MYGKTNPDGTAENPAVRSYTPQALREIEEILSQKRAGYTGHRNEFWNFEYAADAANISPMDAIVSQLGIKMGRLKAQRDTDSATYEIMDTARDILGYAVLLYARVLSDADKEDDIPF